MTANPSPQPSPFEGEGARDRPVGEVVEASTTGFVAQCHRLYEAPPLGALVRTGGESPVYGVVADIATRSLDPGRRPMALGQEEATADAVYRNNPQLDRLLSTDLHVIAIAHRAEGRLVRRLAPQPPRIHEHVYLCGLEELREVSGSLEFLSLLLEPPVGARDEVAAAFLRQAAAAHSEPRRFLVNAGQQVAGLLGGQLQRLNGVLRRLSP